MMTDNIEGEITEREARESVGMSEGIAKREPLRGGGHFMGVKLYENANLKVPVRIRRPWRERLFEVGPWQPFERYNYSLVPDPQLYSHGLAVVGHPVTLSVMRCDLAGTKGRLGLAEILGRFWWPDLPLEFVPANELPEGE